MTGRDFFFGVKKQETLELLDSKQGEKPADDRVYVQDKKRGTITEVLVSAILQHDWKDLLAVMLGFREAKIMRHVTRIVGYYSELRNWNPSKIAELADRHRGSYIIPEVPMSKSVAA